jgi:hypothetical protein
MAFLVEVKGRARHDSEALWPIIENAAIKLFSTSDSHFHFCSWQSSKMVVCVTRSVPDFGT